MTNNLLPSDILKMNKVQALALVQEDGNQLMSCNANAQSDPKIVMAAIKNNNAAFKFASDTLKNNKPFVMKVIEEEKTSLFLEFISNQLKDDKDLVLLAMSFGGRNLKLASTRLKNDFDVVLSAVTQDGFALKFVAGKLKDSDEIGYASIKDDLTNFVFLSPRMQRDKKVCEFMYSKSISEFFKLKSHLISTNHSPDADFLDNFLKTRKHNSKESLEKFINLDKACVIENGHFISFMDFKRDYRETFEYIVSKLDPIDLNKLESDVPEIKEILTRQKILNLEIDKSSKKKERKLKFG